MFTQLKKSHSICFIISGPTFIHACYNKGENPFETTATEYNQQYIILMVEK